MSDTARGGVDDVDSTGHFGGTQLSVAGRNASEVKLRFRSLWVDRSGGVPVEVQGFTGVGGDSRVTTCVRGFGVGVVAVQRVVAVLIGVAGVFAGGHVPGLT